MLWVGGSRLHQLRQVGYRLENQERRSRRGELERDAGYKPVRVMFYYPNRDQAVRIQKTLESLYKSVRGEYHYADAAWAYVKKRTGIDLLGILKGLAAERRAGHGE